MDDQYAIVEFNDGLQMIPSSWLTKDKKQAYWPTFTSTERFSKAVQKCIPKMDSWPLYEVKRILATANKYETGMIKLKKAEFISDINSESDDETSKRNRKYRAKTVLSSDEISSNEEENIVKVPSYPKVPSSKVQKKNNNMESNKNPVNKIFKSKDVLKQIENENINLSTTTPSKKSIETNIHLKKTSVERHDSINNTEHDFNHNIKSAHDPQAYFKTDSVNTSITQFERYIIRKLLDIEHKISSIQEQQRNINTKVDYIQNQIQTFGLDDKTKKKDVESDYMELFPVETLEKLQELEQLLINDKINRKALMKQLARIGGTDIKSITFNILRRIMSDSVGSMFSYVGGKKKYPFFDLYLRKIIFSAVRIYFPEATEQNISQPIKSWLRHANERSNKKNLNKSKKSLMQEDENQSNMEQHADRRPQKENMDKRAESVARVCLQEDNQEADDDDGDETTLDDLIGPNLF